ncbi:MAG: tetratricopeptide repeat protein, partial [Holophagales bacterium]|nr:tetratricopeptide repeat protein [Holophagales bacterium]
TWRSGSFRVVDELPEVDSPLKVKVPQLVVIGIDRFAGDEEVNGAVGPLVGKKLFLHPSPPYPLDEIRLSRLQEQVVAHLRDGKRIDELAAETTIPFDKIMRLLYSLAVIGIVVPEEALPDGAALEPTPTAAPTLDDTMAIQLEQRQPLPDMAPADAERLQDRVMETYLRYRSQDAFELLGLEETADLVAVQDAFVGFSRRFAPWQFRGPGLEGLAEKARDLFIAGGQAFGELCDVEKRNALLARRQHARDESSKRPTSDRFAIKSNLLDSELQFKKGKKLAQQGKHREALDQLQFAYDCDPQNSIYRSELAYCRFLANPAVEGRRSLDELAETLRIDPRCGLAAYYAGMVAMELDLFEEAEGHLQKAIKMLSPDRRPIEGLKELQGRVKQKRKRLGFLGGG